MSRVSVSIRPAQHADVGSLASLIAGADTFSGVFGAKAMLDSRPSHTAERLHEILDEGARTILVAIDGDQVVGMLVARSEAIGAIDLTPALHVTHLLVAPAHRRRGAGRALLAAAVQLADDLGLERVLTTVASGSREANRYLARLGFAPLVVHRIASTASLRRTLGLGEISERVAALRRARLVTTRRARPAVRVATRRA